MSRTADSRLLLGDGRRRVMGILNATPDSFYPGSRAPDRAAALERARQMIHAGVDIVDVGGESSRPGSEPVSLEVELERVIPVIEAIRRESDTPISVDTTKAAVAEAALSAGADMVNDITALRGDPRMAEVVAKSGAWVVLMHMRGTPKTMQRNPHYDDVVAAVSAELESWAEQAVAAGIDRGRIVIDPGIGFGKRLEDNLTLLRDLEALRKPGYPILVGLSRKSFLGRVLDGQEVDHRLVGSLVGATVALAGGAEIVRVHDYRESIEMVRLFEAIDRGRPA